MSRKRTRLSEIRRQLEQGIRIRTGLVTLDKRNIIYLCNRDSEPFVDFCECPRLCGLVSYKAYGFYACTSSEPCSWNREGNSEMNKPSRKQKQKIKVICDAELCKYYYNGLEMDLNEWLNFQKEHRNDQIIVLTINRPRLETVRRTEIPSKE